MNIGALLVSFFICGAFSSVCILLFTADIPATAEKFAFMLFGALGGSFGQMTQYWFGSSASGEKKDDAIAKVATTATTAAGTVAGTEATKAAHDTTVTTTTTGVKP